MKKKLHLLLSLLFLLISCGRNKIPYNVSYIINKVYKAYSELSSATFNGYVNIYYEIEGAAKNETSHFNSFFKSPSYFRHIFENKIIVGSTGSNIYRFEIDSNRYLLFPLPLNQNNYVKLPYQISDVLQGQNPSLIFTITANKILEILSTATNIQKRKVVYIRGCRCETFQFTFEFTTFIWYIDTDTHLLQRIEADFREDVKVKNRWVHDVKHAQYTIDYTDILVNPKLNSSLFNWQPPLDALEIPTVTN